jgi:hypothetical protein
MTTMSSTRVLLSLTVLAVACGDREQDFAAPIDLLPPVAVKNGLVLVDRGGDRVFALATDALSADTHPAIAPLPSEPLLAVAHNGSDDALVLTDGQRATSRQDAKPSALCTVRVTGLRKCFTLGNPFDSLAQSADGRYAMVYRTGRAMRVIENRNEIALVDFEADEVTPLSLENLGDTPRSVFFSPEMEILGEVRRLALVLSERNVAIIDLNYPKRQETTVQLSQQGSVAVAPAQVLFSANAPVIYLRASNSDDLFAFQLTERPGGSEGADGKEHNDFRPTLNQLGVGARPSDMALFGDEQDARLLTIAENGYAVVVVETATGRPTSVPLSSLATNILLFEAESPRDDNVAPRALLYARDSATLTFVDLADLESRGERNLEELVLEAPVRKLIPLEAESLVMVLHDDGVSLVSLDSRTVAPISTSVALEDALFDEVGRQLWVGPSGQPWLGSLDLETGEPNELLLDAPIEALVPLFDDGMIAVVHSSDVGHLTVIDLDDPDREHATALRGFFLDGILDRGER